MVKEVVTLLVLMDNVTGPQPSAAGLLFGSRLFSQVVNLGFSAYHANDQFSAVSRLNGLVIIVDDLEFQDTGDGLAKRPDRANTGWLVGKPAFDGRIPLHDFDIETLFKIFPDGLGRTRTDHRLDWIVAVVVRFRNVEDAGSHATQQ